MFLWGIRIICMEVGPTLDVILARNAEELERCFALRYAVFCAERGVSPEIERDELDAPGSDREHFLFWEDGSDIGAARCRYLGDTAVIQRLCILKAHRGRGQGRAAMAAVEGYCRAVGIRRVELDAKFEVCGFYEACGYTRISAPFQEAGIPHVKMRKELFE